METKAAIIDSLRSYFWDMIQDSKVKDLVEKIKINSGQNQYGYYISSDILKDSSKYNFLRSLNITKIVDLGSGPGHFMKALLDLNLVQEAYGVEIEPSLINYAREHPKKCLPASNIFYNNILNLDSDFFKKFEFIYSYQPFCTGLGIKLFLDYITKQMFSGQIFIYSSTSDKTSEKFCSSICKNENKYFKLHYSDEKYNFYCFERTNVVYQPEDYKKDIDASKMYLISYANMLPCNSKYRTTEGAYIGSVSCQECNCCEQIIKENDKQRIFIKCKDIVNAVDYSYYREQLQTADYLCVKFKTI